MNKDQLRTAQFEHAIAGVRQGHPTHADFEIISKESNSLKNGQESIYQKALSDPRIPDHILLKYIEANNFKGKQLGVPERFLDASHLLNPKISEEYLLNCYKHNYFLIYIAQNPSLPKDLIPALIKSHAEEVAANVMLGPDNFSNLFLNNQEHYYILKNLFSNPSLPIEYVENEFKKNTKNGSAFWIFYSMKTPLHMLEPFLQKALEIYPESISFLIANHPSLSEDLVMTLMSRSSVLGEMGLRSNLSPAAVEKMLSLNNILNIRNLTKNPDLSRDSFFALFNFIKNKYPQTLEEKSYFNLSLNRGVPTEILLELQSGDFSEEVKFSARTNPHHPENQIRTFLKLPLHIN